MGEDVPPPRALAPSEVSVEDAKYALRELEARLSQTYSRLHRERGDGDTVFAIEHGLAAGELRNLKARLGRVMRWHPGRLLARDYWLCWAAFGAEVGFSCLGTGGGPSYWAPFREALGEGGDAWGTPLRPGDDDLVEIYQRFKREFGGPEPRSRFAKKFSKIAWPLANALLPKDLQRHLIDRAQRCGGEVSLALQGRHPGRLSLSEVLRGSGVGLSSRFLSFLDYQEIVDAAVRLLLEPQGRGPGVFSPDLRERLIGALDEARQAAVSDLRSTHVASVQRARAGLGTPRSNPPRLAPASSPRAPRAQLVACWDDGIWSLWLQPVGLLKPAGHGLAAHEDSLRWIDLRFRLSSASPVPADELLRPGCLLPVEDWRPGEPCVEAALGDRHEALRADLDPLLQGAILPDLPVLLRVGREGFAYPARQLGEGDYLWLTAAWTPAPGQPWQRARCAVRGVNVYSAALQPGDAERALAAIRASPGRIVLAQALKLWPVGAASFEQLPGALLIPSGPAQAVALTFNLRARLRLRLHVAEEVRSELEVDHTPGTPTLFELPEGLPTGDHRLEVLSAGQLLDWVDLLVRPPPEDEGRLVRVIIRPEDPTLEDLLDGELTPVVLGPPETRVTLTLEVNASVSPPASLRSEREITVSAGQPSEATRTLDDLLFDLPLQGAAARDARLSVTWRGAELFTSSLERTEETSRRWVERPDGAVALLLDGGEAVRGGLSYIPADQPWLRQRATPNTWHEAPGLYWTLRDGARLVAPNLDHRASLRSLSGRGLRVALENGGALSEAAKSQGDPQWLRRARRWLAAAITWSVAEQLRLKFLLPALSLAEDEAAQGRPDSLRNEVASMVDCELKARILLSRPVEPVDDLVEGAQRLVQSLTGFAIAAPHMTSLLDIAAGCLLNSLIPGAEPSRIDIAELIKNAHHEPRLGQALAIARVLLLTHDHEHSDEPRVATQLYAGWAGGDR